MDKAPFDITEDYVSERLKSRMALWVRVDIWFKNGNEEALSFLSHFQKVEDLIADRFSGQFVVFPDLAAGKQIFATDTISRIAIHNASEEEMKRWFDEAKEHYESHGGEI